MKKIFYILGILLVTTTASVAQKVCCPDFRLSQETTPCNEFQEPNDNDNGSGSNVGGTAPDQECLFSACKHSKQNYTVFPMKPGYVYTWQITGGSSAATGNPMSVNWGSGETGQIKVFISNQNGTCKDTISTTFCLKNAPVANFSFSPTSPVCLNQGVQFSNSSSGATSTYWNFGDGTTSSQVNPNHVYSSPGTYTVTLSVSNGTTRPDSPTENESQCGCIDVIAKTITVKAESGISIILGCKQMLCKGDSASYSTASQCSSYNWSVTGGHIDGSSSGSTINVIWDGSAPATVTLAGNCGGACGNSSTLNVPVLYPVMPITGNTIVCPSDFSTYSLPAMPGTNYNWVVSGGGYISGFTTDTSTINVQWGSMASATPYTVSCTYSNPMSNCSGTASLAVSILPRYKIIGPVRFCVGDPFTFGANGSGSWTVTPSAGHSPASFSSGSSISGVWNSPGAYTITANPTTPSNFCSYPATITVMVYAKPILNAIVGTTLICPGSSQLYTASSNINDGFFSWNILGGSLISLIGNHHESATVQWNPVGPYLITVNQTVNGCTSADETLQLVPYQQPIITGSAITCMDTELIYTVATPAPVGGYSWTLSNGLGTIISGQGTNTIHVMWHGSLTSVNSCNLTVTTCGGTHTITVNITVPTPLVITKIGSLCSAAGITLTASTLGTYVWNKDGVNLTATSQSITIQNPGLYTVSVTNANNCKSTATIFIAKESLSLSAFITTGTKVIYDDCHEPIFNVLSASPSTGGYCYQWYMDSSPTGLGTAVGTNSSTYNATSAGYYYWCEVSSFCGSSCRAVTNKIRIIKFVCPPLCNPNYTTAVSSTNCNPFTFTGTTVPATAAGAVHWYFGDSFEGVGGTVTHQYLSVGIFNVCAEFGNNDYCSKVDCKTVSVNIAANFSVSVHCDTVSFTNLSQEISPGLITSYYWSFGNGGTSTLQNPPSATFITGGSHTATLTITDGNCPITYSVNFTTTVLDATMACPALICAKSAAPFTATSSNPNLSYNWAFGDGYISNLQNTDHAYAAAGSYTVTLTVTDINGCQKNYTKPITVAAELIASIGPDKTICPGSSVTLSASPTFLTYQWYKDGGVIAGATASAYVTSLFGEYWVMVANGSGCTASSNHCKLLYDTAPIADIKGETTQCSNAGGMILYNSIAEAGCTYVWTVTGPGAVSFSPSNTIFNPIAMATIPGEYQFSLTVTNAGGCISKDIYCITLVTSPTVTVTAPAGEHCEGKLVTFTASATPSISPDNYIFRWSNGVVGATMSTGNAGNYSVMAINPSGCSGTAYAGTIKPRSDVSLFPKGCLTMCLTGTLNFPLPSPLPMGGYTIAWFDDDGTAVTSIGNGPSLLLSTLQPGIHHLHASVSFGNGCVDTTAVFDLNIKDCTLLAECDNCKSLLSTSNAEADTNITTNSSCQSSNESITFTILKPVKEVRISLADLKYSWKDPSCVNCKVQMLERGCLFAPNANQPLGTLLPNTSTAVNLLSSAPTNNCPDELIWNGGTPLQPGTYTIPLQLSLPKPTTKSCVLILDKACFHLTLIDMDCKRCERVFCKEDKKKDTKECACNAGNIWTGLYLLPSQAGIPVHRDQILCNTTLTGITANMAYTLSGIYHCKTNCASTVNEITVYDQLNQIIYTKVSTAVYESISFPSSGMYSIKLLAHCGGNSCECAFRVNVSGGGTETDPPPTTNPPTVSIDIILKKLLPHDFNGEILVSKNGETVFEKYYSYKDKVTSHTAFDLASVTKTFTAMAILKLMEDGKLNIDDAVKKYLPEFPVPEITVKMLLSHKSGLEDYLKFMDESNWDKSKNLTNSDLLQFIIKNKSKVLINTPGKSFDYSNTNFALLALIIEKTTNQSYADYLTTTFFKPLQMNDTYVMGLANYATATKSFYKNGKVYSLRYLDLIYGDKNVYSTVQDLKKWDQALRGQKMFKKSTTDLAYAPTSGLTPFVSNYGLGWKKIVTTKDNDVIYHTGWWAGNRSLLIRLVKDNVMIAVVSNNNFSNISDIKKLCDLFGDYQLTNKKIDNF